MKTGPFSLLIKPASADCNFTCEYCFYLCKKNLYPRVKTPRMTPEVLETLIRSYMETGQPVCSFGWQGGEPLLMGADFFKEAVRLQQAHGRQGARVHNGLQTNGSLLTPELARHLREFNFLTGISVDGPGDLHDRYRKTSGGTGTYTQVIRGLELLREAGAEVNVLTLVSAANADQPLKVFRHLVEDLGLRYLQFIPCVEFSPEGLRPWSITAGQWGVFLNTVFDEWQVRWRRRVSVRNFDAVLHLLAEGRSVSCDHGTDCREYLVVEHNGDVYPCDFFVKPELKLGNILTHSWEEMRSSPLYAAFGALKLAARAECAGCPYWKICAGDCVKHRGRDTAAAPEKSLLCAGYKAFYHHTLPAFMQLAHTVRRQS
ncbi:MAG: anaerobic sulfatase maturase [Spirochaetales bacterium]|nr:MAG: anaerobic sulfatase maturase [Spirochaetales bacterium]